jgi:hypothetical protein
MATKIEVEAFNVNIHGSKILLQGPWSANKYPPVMEYIEKLRDPFKRKILISKTPFSFSKALPLQYDATFQIKELSDWSLILTYMTYSPKPLLVIAEEIEVPDAIWAKLTNTTTFVHITATPIRNFRAYDVIFFAPIDDTPMAGFGKGDTCGTPMGGYTDYVFRTIQMVYRASYSQKEFREIINELRVAGAGLAYYNNAIYWYDVVTTQGGETISKKQLSELFSWLAIQFS